jgi:hypothetical protein
MKRLALVLLLTACGSSDQADPSINAAKPRLPLPPSVAAERPDPEALEESRSAAAALRRYYDLIAARRYREAWLMRADEPGRPRASYAAFAAGYDRHADYHATVGAPSAPAEGSGMLWVEVQVQRWGRMRDGTPFGDVGIVVLRRPLGSGGEAHRWEIVG